MLLKEFGEELAKKMLKNDTITESISFNGKRGDEEINDSFDIMYNIEFDNGYRNSRLMFRFDKPMPDENYDSGLILIMNVKDFSMIDLYTGLIEMGYIRIFLRCLCINRSKGFMSRDVVMSIMDDMIFMDNVEGLEVILNTDIISICQEDDGILYKLMSGYNEEGYPIYNALEYDKEFLCNMVGVYTDSTRCIPVLLEYIKDHYDDKEDITL